MDQSIVNSGSVIGPRTGQRILFVDAARATAMLFVFVSHFADSYFRSRGESSPILRQITLVASPTFLVISGAMIGFLWRTRPDFDRLRVRLTDRGLFLLTIGHLLIAGPLALRGDGDVHAFSQYIYTTDVIGVCMIIEPWLIGVLRPAGRLALAVAAFAVSWWVAVTWHPHVFAAEALQETIFGSEAPKLYVYAFPLLPWFGLDLAGTVLGEKLGALWLKNDNDGMMQLMLKVGFFSIAAATGLKILYIVVARFVTPSNHFFALTTPFQKSPPSLAYFLFYGGVGVGGILPVWLYLERRGSAFVRWAAALGQTSLMMFITQSYVYYSGIYTLKASLDYRLWPVWCVLSIIMVLVPALVWHRLGWNRFLTIGYRHFHEKYTGVRQAPAPS